MAQEAHLGQTDKLGRDYFAAHLTPIATGLREFGPEAEAAGWLHDIIEDTHHTGDTLRAAGVPEDVVAAVESVTKVEGEPYERLIDRACADPIGRLVKLVDNTWNLVCCASLGRDATGRGGRPCEPQVSAGAKDVADRTCLGRGRAGTAATESAC